MNTRISVSELIDGSLSAYFHQIDQESIVRVVWIEIGLFDPIDQILHITQVHRLHVEILPQSTGHLPTSKEKIMSMEKNDCLPLFLLLKRFRCGIIRRNEDFAILHSPSDACSQDAFDIQIGSFRIIDVDGHGDAGAHR